MFEISLLNYLGIRSTVYLFFFKYNTGRCIYNIDSQSQIYLNAYRSRKKVTPYMKLEFYAGGINCIISPTWNDF